MIENQINNKFLKIISKMHQDQLDLKHQMKEITIMNTINVKNETTHFLHSYNFESCIRGYIKHIKKPLRHFCPTNITDSEHTIQKRGIINFVYKTLKWAIKITTAIGLVNFFRNFGDGTSLERSEIDYKMVENQINKKFLKIISKMHQDQLDLKHQMKEITIMNTINRRFAEIENITKQMFRPDNDQLA